MNDEQMAIEKMHEAEGRELIKQLTKKIDTTKYNIEISDEIIGSTPSNSQREKLIEKNTQRRHAIGSMKKEIETIEQTLEQRRREVST